MMITYKHMLHSKKTCKDVNDDRIHKVLGLHDTLEMQNRLKQLRFHKFQIQKNKTITKNKTRTKRGIMSSMTAKLAEKLTMENLGGLVIDGLGSFINWQKDKTMKKGIDLLQKRQNELRDKIIKVDNDLLSVAQTTSTAIKDIWNKLVKQNSKIYTLAKQLKQLQNQFVQYDEIIHDQEHALKILAWSFGTLQTLLQHNLDNYDQLYTQSEILFNALDSLSTGRLNHHVVSATKLTSYLKHIEQVIELEFPGYEIAMKEINKYYDMNLISFIAKDSVLYLHIPIFLKLRDQPTLELYKVKSLPIPYDPADLIHNMQMAIG